MTAPIVKSPAHLAQRLSWQELLEYFNIDSEMSAQLSEKLKDNYRSNAIIFHLNRFVEKFTVGERLSDDKVNELYSICGILESMDSPFIPFPSGVGVKDYEEWKFEVSPVEYWNVDKVVNECKVVYSLVDVDFPQKRRYSKGDIYDMLFALVKLGRLY